MRMCVCVFVCLCAFVCVCAHTHTRTHTHTHTRADVHITFDCMRRQMPPLFVIHKYKHKCSHARTHPSLPHVHAHVYSLPLPLSLSHAFSLFLTSSLPPSLSLFSLTKIRNGTSHTAEQTCTHTHTHTHTHTRHRLSRLRRVTSRKFQKTPDTTSRRRRRPTACAKRCTRLILLATRCGRTKERRGERDGCGCARGLGRV